MSDRSKMKSFGRLDEFNSPEGPEDGVNKCQTCIALIQDFQ